MEKKRGLSPQRVSLVTSVSLPGPHDWIFLPTCWPWSSALGAKEA